MPTARALRVDHFTHGTSTQTIYRVKPGGYRHSDTAWERLGPYEDDTLRVLIGTGQEYVLVTNRQLPQDLAATIAGVKPSAMDLSTAANRVAPMVAVVLGLAILRGQITEWDTDETVALAGYRIALDGGWDICNGRRLVSFGVADEDAVFEAAIALIEKIFPGLPKTPKDAAEAWLRDRFAIREAATALGAQWGDRLLNAAQAAGRAGIAAKTWTGYVARHYAPTPDEGGPDGVGPSKWLSTTADASRVLKSSI
jgi:hypothetical protein